MLRNVRPIPVLDRTVKSEIKIEIQKLRSEGKSLRAIAAVVGLGKTTVEYHCNSEHKLKKHRERRRDLKRRLVALFGGKCQVCTYSRSLSALDFHHLDPAKKEFAIARMDKFSLMVEEAKKCMLLCSNCHHEVHDGILDVKSRARESPGTS